MRTPVNSLVEHASRFGGSVLAFVTNLTVASPGAGLKNSSEVGSGAEEGGYLLGLTEGGSEGVREDTEGGEVLLEFGDSYRECLCAGIEGGEALFELGGAVSEAVDLRVEVGSQGGAGAAQPQTCPKGGDARYEGDEGAHEHWDGQKRHHARVTVARGRGTLQTLESCYNLSHAAGWSSQVARRAHNPKVAGSNPAPATKEGPAFARAFVFAAQPRTDALHYETPELLSGGLKA